MAGFVSQRGLPVLLHGVGAAHGVQHPRVLAVLEGTTQLVYGLARQRLDVTLQDRLQLHIRERAAKFVRSQDKEVWRRRQVVRSEYVKNAFIVAVHLSFRFILLVGFIRSFSSTKD